MPHSSRSWIKMLPNPRLLLLCISLFVIVIMLYTGAKHTSTTAVETAKTKAYNFFAPHHMLKEPANTHPEHEPHHYHHASSIPPHTGSATPTPHTFDSTLRELFSTIKQPIAATQFTDPEGNVFELDEEPLWTKPLGKDILIVDIDSRLPKKILNPQEVDWENLDGGRTTVSEALINHYTYAQIHGYDYRFYQARRIAGHGKTWVKIYAMEELLREYRFVVFLDADASVHHMNVPLEWMFNRWGITNNTSIAMPVDNTFVRPEDNPTYCHTCDSKGKLMLNTGFVITQQLPHTFEMFDAWKKCTNEERYEGCGQWKHQWAHEQRAFAEYIRYDYNPDGNNIVEIPCSEAMGYPDMPNDIEPGCVGHFIRHYTMDKGRVKQNMEQGMMQAIIDRLQKLFLRTKSGFFIEQEKFEEDETPTKDEAQLKDNMGDKEASREDLEK